MSEALKLQKPEDFIKEMKKQADDPIERIEDCCGN
jgi:hypothetical protein